MLNESVDIGQSVSPGTDITQIVGTAVFWVQASVPASQIPVISGALDQANPTPPVQVHRVGENEHPMEGRLVRLLGQVDPEGRMAQVLIELPDPLQLKNPAGVPLPLNSYVRVDIDGGTLTHAVPIPREGLRENSLLWVADETHHLMVYVIGPDGHAVQEAKLGYLVEGPDGAKQKLMAMGMQGAYGANVNFNKKGMYTIKVKCLVGDKKLFDRFSYEVK